MQLVLNLARKDFCSFRREFTSLLEGLVISTCQVSTHRAGAIWEASFSHSVACKIFEDQVLTPFLCHFLLQVALRPCRPPSWLTVHRLPMADLFLYGELGNRDSCSRPPVGVHLFSVTTRVLNTPRVDVRFVCVCVWQTHKTLGLYILCLKVTCSPNFVKE